jgi:hypothetical protein
VPALFEVAQERAAFYARAMKTNLLVLLSLTLLSFTGCATLSSGIAEDKANAALRKPMASVVYTTPRAELAKAIARDAERAEKWHRENTPMYALGTSLASKEYKFNGEACDLKDASLTDAVDSEECKGIERHPIELRVAKETFVLAPVKGEPNLTRVQILNTADGKRKYTRELEFYSQLNPAGAAKVRTAVLTEKPDLKLDATF